MSSWLENFKPISGAVLVALFVISAHTSPAQADDEAVAIPVDKMPWQKLEGTPLNIVRLWGDPNGYDHAYLLKLPAGFSPGRHTHTGNYHGVNLTGTWVHTFEKGNAKLLKPGSYVMQPGMTAHNDHCEGPDDCILYVHQHAPFDFIPSKE